MTVLSQLGLQRFHLSERGQSLSSGRGSGSPSGAVTGVGGSGGTQGGNTGGGGGTGTATRSVRVNNSEFNSMFQLFHDMRTVTCRMLKTRISNGELPPLSPSKMNSSMHMCLPWHKRAQCMTNCNSVADHVACISNEYALHLTWCTEHFWEA